MDLEKQLSAFVSSPKEASGWVVESSVYLEVELLPFKIVSTDEVWVLTFFDWWIWDFQIAYVLYVQQVELVAWVLLWFLLLQDEVYVSLVEWLVELV